MRAPPLRTFRVVGEGIGVHECVCVRVELRKNEMSTCTKRAAKCGSGESVFVRLYIFITRYRACESHGPIS